MIASNEIDSKIDNTGDFNPVKKVGDRCSFMGCDGKVYFDRYDTMDNEKYIVLTCPKCGTESYKKIKGESNV